MKKLILIFMVFFTSFVYSQTIESISDGNWNDPSTWQDSIVPTDENIIIKHNITGGYINYNSINSSNITIDIGAKLILDSLNLNLNNLTINGFFKTNIIKGSGTLLGDGTVVTKEFDTNIVTDDFMGTNVYNSIYFGPGSDNYIDFGSLTEMNGFSIDPPTLTNELTVGFWVKWAGTPSSSTNGSWANMVSLVTESGTNGDNGSVFWFQHNQNNDRFEFAARANSRVYKWQNGNTIDQEGRTEWYFLTGVYDGTNVKIYINGQFRGQNSLSGNLNMSNPETIKLMVGRWANSDDNGRGFWGNISHISIWNKALTNSEIYTLMHKHQDITNVGGEENSGIYNHQNLLGYWKFDMNTNDETINDNGGDINGTDINIINNNIDIPILYSSVNNDGVNLNVMLNWDFNHNLDNDWMYEGMEIWKNGEFVNLVTDINISSYTDNDVELGQEPTYKIRAKYLVLNSYQFSVFSNIVSYLGSPLPIELLSFELKHLDNKIELEWVTATEINNDYFTIEKSSDLRTWEVVGTLSGSGDSNTPIRYVLIDNDPTYGVSYYRLTQTDYDGQFETFDPISTYWNPDGNIKIKIYDFMGVFLKEEYISSINNYIIPKFGKPVIVIFYSNDEIIKTVKIF